MYIYEVDWGFHKILRETECIYSSKLFDNVWSKTKDETMR